MRVVLDSSVLIAAYVARAGVCAELYEEILQHHRPVLSRHILEEVARKLRSKFLVGEELITRTIRTIEQAAEMVEPITVPAASCRDPDDLPVLGTAVAGRAELLVVIRGDAHIPGKLRSEGQGIPGICEPGSAWKRLVDPTRD